MKLQQDLREFIELLNSHGVEYLVVGGHAVGSGLSDNNRSIKIPFMKNAKFSQPIRKRVRVQKGRRAEITNLPFPPGSQIDVIITAAQARASKKSAESIYDHTAAVVRRKRIPHYSIKQIEEIIHQSRASRGTLSPS